MIDWLSELIFSLQAHRHRIEGADRQLRMCQGGGDRYDRAQLLSGRCNDNPGHAAKIMEIRRHIDRKISRLQLVASIVQMTFSLQYSEL